MRLWVAGWEGGLTTSPELSWSLPCPHGGPVVCTWWECLWAALSLGSVLGRKE